MTVSDRFTANLIKELLDADLPASALQVYLALYRLSVLQGQRTTELITVLEIAENIGRGENAVTGAIKCLRGHNLRKRKWLRRNQPGNRAYQYEVMTPKLGSVWDASRKRPPAIEVEKKIPVRAGKRTIYVRSTKANSD